MTYKFTEEAIKDKYKFALVSEYTREVILNKINEEIKERGPSHMYFVQIAGEYLTFNNRELNGIPILSVKFFVSHSDLVDIPEPLKEIEAGIWIDVKDLKNYNLSEAISDAYVVVATTSDNELKGNFMSHASPYAVGSLINSKMLEIVSLDDHSYDLYMFDRVMFIPSAAKTKKEG